MGKLRPLVKLIHKAGEDGSMPERQKAYLPNPPPGRSSPWLVPAFLRPHPPQATPTSGHALPQDVPFPIALRGSLLPCVFLCHFQPRSLCLKTPSAAKVVIPSSLRWGEEGASTGMDLTLLSHHCSPTSALSHPRTPSHPGFLGTASSVPWGRSSRERGAE